MKCIYCGCEELKVIDSRENFENNSIRRRRECLKCGKRFTTYETIETFPILVIKHDGRRQTYDVNKIKAGIMKSCEKRPITISQIDEIVSQIDRKIQNEFSPEVASSHIGELVMDSLKDLDEIAYIRYACVYRSFKDVTHLMDFLKEYNHTH